MRDVLVIDASESRTDIAGESYSKTLDLFRGFLCKFFSLSPSNASHINSGMFIDGIGRTERRRTRKKINDS
jgi:hypothetical protein